MGTEHFMPLSMSIVLTEDYNVMVKSEELIGATEYLTPFQLMNIQTNTEDVSKVF